MRSSTRSHDLLDIFFQLPRRRHLNLEILAIQHSLLSRRGPFRTNMSISAHERSSFHDRDYTDDRTSYLHTKPGVSQVEYCEVRNSCSLRCDPKIPGLSHLQCTSVWVEVALIRGITSLYLRLGRLIASSVDCCYSIDGALANSARRWDGMKHAQLSRG